LMEGIEDDALRRAIERLGTAVLSRSKGSK
jgi:hypothetical protein